MGTHVPHLFPDKDPKGIMAAKLSLTYLLALPNSSVKIPRLGFGVYQSTSKQCINSCLTALKAGYRHKNGIIVEAYCPLVRNQKSNDPTLNKIAEAHKKTVGHVLIRYCLQKNWVPLPKSDTPSRIVENANVYDFELSKEEMKTLDDLDQGSKGAFVQAVTNTL